MSKSINIMLDLETLGTKPGCKILSLGATTFQLCSRTLSNNMSMSFITTQQGLLDLPDPDTMAWWDKQSPEARKVAFEPNYPTPFVDGLYTFNDWVHSLKSSADDVIYIWACASDFDPLILGEAYARYGIQQPWHGKNTRCFRTLREIGKTLGIAEPEFIGTRHAAYSDAAHQAKWADLILNRIYNRR